MPYSYYVGIISSIKLKRIKDECLQEYLEQMAWTYQGGFNLNATSQEALVITTAHAHINGAHGALVPLYEHLAEDNDKTTVSTRLEFVEHEFLYEFCIRAGLDGQAVMEFVLSEAERFVRDNLKSGESFSTFERRIESQVLKKYATQSWVWKNQVFLSYVTMSNELFKQKMRERENRRNSDTGTDEKVPNAVTERVNWDKVKSPEQMRHQGHGKIVEGRSAPEAKQSKRKTKVPEENKNVKVENKYSRKERPKSRVEVKKKNRKTKEVTRLSDVRARKLVAFLKGEENDSPAGLSDLFSPKLLGASWLCEYHLSYGFGSDEEEALTMAGQHMWYVREDAKKCIIFTREFE